MKNSNLSLDQEQQCMASHQCRNTENIYDPPRYPSTPNIHHATGYFSCLIIMYQNNRNAATNGRMAQFPALKLQAAWEAWAP